MRSIKINEKQARMLKEMGRDVPSNKLMKISEAQYQKILEMETNQKELEMGIDAEKEEHSVGSKEAKKIATDHLKKEDPNYYTKLKSVGLEESDKGVINTPYKGLEIMFEPHYGEYFVGDKQVASLEAGKKYIDNGGTGDLGIYEGMEVGGLPTPREQSFREMPTEGMESPTSQKPSNKITKNFNNGLNNEVRREIGNLYEDFINELYGLNEDASSKYSKLISLMENVGYIANGKLKKGTFGGNKETVREAISQGLYELHHGGTHYKAMESIERRLKENSGYPAGAANDPSAPYNQNQRMSKPEVSQHDLFNVVWFDNEDALLTDKSNNKYIFNIEKIDKALFEPYVEREQTDSYSDEEGDHYTEYSDEWEIDSNAIQQFLNNEHEGLNKGEGVDAFENGEVELVRIDEELGNYLVRYFKADDKLKNFLLSMEETTASSSGAFVAPLSDGEKYSSNLPDELDETTTATSSGPYDSPKAIDTSDENFWFEGNKQNKGMNETNYRSGFEMTEQQQLEYNYHTELKQMQNATSQPEQQMLAKRVIEAAKKLGVNLPKEILGLAEGKKKVIKITEAQYKKIQESSKKKRTIKLTEAQYKMVSEVGGSPSSNLVPLILNAITQVDENLSYKDLAEAVGVILIEHYGKHTFDLFMQTLSHTLKQEVNEDAKTDTQFPEGGFVDIDDCTKLNNNTKAQDGGCSQGAVDNVVTVKKSKNSVVAKKKSNIKEGVMREALKLQHDREKQKLIVISDLEGKAANKETFTNKKILKQNGFIWTGKFWAIEADRLEDAKRTLTLINKADYLIDTLEDVEEAIAGSAAENKDLLSARLDQYIMDLANATDEAALSAEIRRYLTFFSKFHNYSFNNRILIYIQRPTATRVSSFRNWKSKHRQVKRGAKGIDILVPIIRKDARTKAKATFDIPGIEKLMGKQYDKEVSGWRVGKVFDIADTEAIDERGDIPDTPKWDADNTPSEKADMLFRAVSEVASDMGVKITADMAKRGEKGYSGGDHINISSGVEGVGRFSTMVHEVAHELMHRKESSIYFIDNSKEGNVSALRELQAESVSYVVLKHYNMPVEQHATYLALWRANKEKIQNNLKIISKVSQFIITKMDEELSRGEEITQSA
tara:strand:+ start:90632 stop:93991 length:3360 start_codon:yes stop_codon:yes gene_type:complete